MGRHTKRASLTESQLQVLAYRIAIWVVRRLPAEVSAERPFYFDSQQVHQDVRRLKALGLPYVSAADVKRALAQLVAALVIERAPRLPSRANRQALRFVVFDADRLTAYITNQPTTIETQP